jgi:hypothetical protein
MPAMTRPDTPFLIVPDTAPNPAEGWIDMSQQRAPQDGSQVDILYWDGAVAKAVRYIEASEVILPPPDADELIVVANSGFRRDKTQSGALCVLGMTHWRPARLPLAA